MLNYNPSQLTDNVTLLEEFHKIQSYLTEHPLYQQYGSQAIYQAGKTDYSLDTVIKPAGSKLGVGDVIIFSNVYYGIVTAVSETTFTVETAVNFRGAQGEQGKQGETGPQGATGSTGPAGKDGQDGYGTFAVFVGQKLIPTNSIVVPLGAYKRPAVSDTVILLSSYVEQYVAYSQIAMSSIRSYDAVNGQATVYIEKVIDTKGERGSTGPQGATGAQGPEGATGATGPQGEDGLPALVYNDLWGYMTKGTYNATTANFNRLPKVNEKVIIFSSQNQYGLATISNVNETLTQVTIENVVSTLGARGPVGPAGTNGTNGKDGNATFLYGGALSASVASIAKAQVTVPSGRSIQVDDIIISSFESTFGAMTQVTAIGDTTVNVDFIGTLQSGGSGSGGGVGKYTTQLTADNFHTIDALFSDNLIAAWIEFDGMVFPVIGHYKDNNNTFLYAGCSDMSGDNFGTNMVFKKTSLSGSSWEIHTMYKEKDSTTGVISITEEVTKSTDQGSSGFVFNCTYYVKE